MQVSLLRLPEVEKRTGLSKASIYLRIKQGNFPKPVKIGERAVAWPSDKIDEYVNGLITDSYKNEASYV